MYPFQFHLIFIISNLLHLFSFHDIQNSVSTENGFISSLYAIKWIQKLFLNDEQLLSSKATLHNISDQSNIVLLKNTCMFYKIANLFPHFLSKTGQNSTKPATFNTYTEKLKSLLHL